MVQRNSLGYEVWGSQCEELNWIQRGSNVSQFYTSSVWCFCHRYHSRLVSLIPFCVPPAGFRGLCFCIQKSINQSTSFCEVHSGLGDNKIIMFSGFSSPFYFLQLQCSSSMHFYYVFWIGTKMVISEIPIWLPFKSFTYNAVCLMFFVMQMGKDDRNSKRCLVKKVYLINLSW